MTREETKSCIGTIKMLQRLAYNIHGVMDVIDADNCKKIIKALEQEPCEDEKIIRIKKGTLKVRTGRYVIYDVEWLKTHFNTTEAKIYGQPQPKERTEERTEMHACDYISRKAVLESLHRKFADGFDSDRWWNSTVVLYAISETPSVTPQSKTEQGTHVKKGHWIEHKHGGIEHIECSECGIWFLKADLPRKSYCPNCGSCNGDMIKSIMRDIGKQ